MSRLVSGLMVAVFIVVMTCGTGNEAVAQESHNRNPAVLVELFTSEGCSSCPPADQVLERLRKEHPVERVDIITLGEHVPYWNYLGWNDPFSSPVYEERQRHYAGLLKKTSVYTPQMIVDGQSEFVGSDYHRALSQIAISSNRPKADIYLAVTKGPSGQLVVEGQIARPEGLPGRRCDIYLAVVEDDLFSSVTRGENSGRRLDHAAVVRQLSVIGNLSAGESPSFRTTINLAPLWKSDDLRLVVFAQDNATGAIVGVAQHSLTP